MKNTLVSAVAGLLLAGTGAAQALTFDLTFTAGTGAEAKAAFTAAANLWSATLHDDVTVRLTVGTASLGSGILGQAGSRDINFSYTQLRDALYADRSSLADNIAVAHLAAGSGVNMLINRTSDNPNGSGAAMPYLDDNNSANNSTISLTAANARALGLSVGIGGVIGGCSNCDGFIEFSTGFTWDYTHSGGAGYDFVGIAAHEIGHTLGFVSGVDELDYRASNPIYPANAFTFVSSLDLFRYSALSTANGAIDWTADNGDKYFSIDGGVSVGPLFSNGQTFGDGRQASHWKDNLGLGIMDPTASNHELLNISANDVKALDVIGWNVSAVPEPASYALFGLGLAALGGLARRRRGA